MLKRIAIALLVVVTGALGPLAILHPTATGAVSLHAPPTPLYQADWSQNPGGWYLYKGFAVSNGVLTYDGSGDAGAFSPFQLKGLANFAVEATFQLGVPTFPDKVSYYLFARRSFAQSATSGIFAGYDAIGGEFKAKHVADLHWPTGGASRLDYYVPGAALQPDTKAHTYRMEVRGNMYRLLVDGQEMVPWTLVKLKAAYDDLGLIFSFIPAKVTAFKVLALPDAQVTTTHDTSAMLSRVIPPRDVPFPAMSGVFRDNNRYALDNAVDLATVRGMGRIFGYLQSFQNATTYIEQSVNLHQSAAGANAAFDLFTAQIRRHASQYGAYQEVDTAALGIGDQSFEFTYHYLYKGSLTYGLRVLFHRGSYYVVITVEAPTPTLSQAAIPLARTADTLVQAGH